MRLPLGALLLCALAAQAQPDTRRSGFADMSPATQAMQRDDGLNPAWLWVKDGEALWTTAAGRSNKACVSCHGEVSTMRGVAARYPVWDAALSRALNLGQRIQQCRTQHQQADAWPAEHAQLLGLEAYVAVQSRGMPIAPSKAPELQPLREQGLALFTQRIGQLNLSCAQCHDGLAGGRLAGSVIPQGHPTAYPLYRLEWQGLGSLQRRVRNCMTGVRAQAPAYDSQDLLALELYLKQRAAGMAWEAPGVRP
ncbi:sulfur oxidation c-type cytochrome SoxA [Roseateles toxinivorans]|uniref:L-cysteine S-thiosulfotransferase subunit SoxA n=1 Tax=Roseateles toxinivorans TaxID=270368 RepID=A0A4R6QGY8_9BURK|nr:sulfur oxidation c-type cytochrome SoxA [Roseateles toxinivorans]TDP61841.1 sulfur-oxidizing protein SoxA [Roseateles toxinivorans]